MSEESEDAEVGKNSTHVAWRVRPDGGLDRRLCIALNGPSASRADRCDTNYVPSDAERVQIRQFCALREEKLSRIDWELDRLNGVLKSVLVKGLAMDAIAKKFSALLAPLRAIPPEVLPEIFLACLPPTHGAIMHSSEAPLLLGRVCSSCRTLSLATPALWASYTRRRWRELKMLEVSSETLSPLHTLTASDVPLLETFEVTDTMFNHPGSDSLALRFLTTPPHLRSISITSHQGTAFIPPLAWHQIDTLQTCVNPRDCKFLFLRTDLHVQALDPVPLSTSSPRITIPHLRTLSVKAEPVEEYQFHLGGLLDRRILPKLQYNELLGIQRRGVLSSDILSSLQRLVLSSSCSLTQVTLRSVSGNPQSLIQCLTASLLLHTLEVDFHPHQFGSGVILAALTVQSATPPLCHLRTTLSISGGDRDEQTHSPIVDLLRSRCQPRPPITQPASPSMQAARLPSPMQVARLRNISVILSRRPTFDIPQLIESLEIDDGPRAYIRQPYDHVKGRKMERWGGLMNGMNIMNSFFHP
ncbi:hypothetical protein C8J57DRAFT_1325632 [Mycena rebaudengoi]|nr:hypothetical protein C8J57DRAFT_1325632 [Mycena rebaudengoi]